MIYKEIEIKDYLGDSVNKFYYMDYLWYSFNLWGNKKSNIRNSL